MEIFTNCIVILVMCEAFILFCPAHSQISIWSSTLTVTDGFTKQLIINCSLTNSTFHDLREFKMSKAPSQAPASFSVISNLNYGRPNFVNVQSSLDADVTGHLDRHVGAFIQYHWSSPSNEMSGVYRCIASGRDERDRPGILFSSHITVTQRDVDLNMMLEEIKKIEDIQQSIVHQLNTAQSQLTNTTNELTNTNANLTNTTNELTNTKDELTKTNDELTKTELELEKTKIELDKLREEKNSPKQTLSRVNFLMSYFFPKTVTYNRHTYYLSYPTFHIHINHTEEICQLMDGHLVEIGDQAEYDVIVDLIKTGNREIGHYYPTYIGMTDREVEGRWRYVYSGDDVTFAKWARDQPDGGTSFNCAGIDYYDYLVYDMYCYNSRNMYYMCEVEGN